MFWIKRAFLVARLAVVLAVYSPVVAQEIPVGGEPEQVAVADFEGAGAKLAGCAAGSVNDRSVAASLGLDADRVLYLTFDDGPLGRYTSKILDVLAKHEIKATFFVVGTMIEGQEAVVRREIAEGHTVGNHQWEHQYAASRDQQREFLRKTKEQIQSMSCDMPLYFRYPYGHKGPWQDAVVKSEGYGDGGIGWDIDSLDYDFGPGKGKAERPGMFRDDFESWVVQQAEEVGGGLVLMHDIQQITADHLDSILTKLKARGFRFGQLPRTVRR